MKNPYAPYKARIVRDTKAGRSYVRIDAPNLDGTIEQVYFPIGSRAYKGKVTPDTNISTPFTVAPEKGR